MTGLLTVREAQERILATLHPTAVETVRAAACAGRILAQPITANADLPPFDNSSMDGFAVLAEDVRRAAQGAPVMLEIVADIPAGAVADRPIRSGQAARIMTGAPLPEGADAVVPVEDTNFAPGSGKSELWGADGHGVNVQIFQPVRPGSSVRRRGDDVRAGTVLLAPGRKLQPQDAGMIASVGLAEVQVYRKPRVALFSSGDELVQPGHPLGPGQIYDSNQTVLAAMLEQHGAEVIRLGSAPDDPRQIEAMLDQAVEQQVDLIITSAGVSVGAFDYVRQVIEAHGSLNFWRVNMRPGKPLAYGSYSGIPLIGLPGNPVSAFVGCRVFVLPALYRLAGRSTTEPMRLKAILAEEVESDGRESYLRAVVKAETPESGSRLLATLTGHQGSGNLYSLVQANALLIVPSGVKSLPSGSEVEVWFLEN